MEENRRILIFIHIPKAGGSTTMHVIGRQYPPSSVWWMSYDRPEKLAAFAALTIEERAELRCLAGHVPFGIHEEVPAAPMYATMLRDPVTRFVSEHGQLKRVVRSGRWRPPVERLASLEDYLDYRIETNGANVQTRLISGCFPTPGSRPPFEPMPADALQRAKDNLRQHFLVVGVMERFDESLLLMKRRLSWPRHVFYARKNTAPRPTSQTEIPPRLRERIAEATAIDAELVRYASQLLQEALSNEGDAFGRELARVRRANGVLSTAISTWKRLIPPGVRAAPGVRHVRTLAHRLMP